MTEKERLEMIANIAQAAQGIMIVGTASSAARIAYDALVGIRILAGCSDEFIAANMEILEAMARGEFMGMNHEQS